MADSDFFVTLRFRGKKFDGQFIPVGALPAIAAYQSTLVELAKSIWRDENPDKKQLPKNFENAFELGLKGIGEGSKVAQLPRQDAFDEDLFSKDFYEDVFLEAQELLAKTVTAANENRSFNPLPENVLKPFERVRKAVSATDVIDVDPVAHGKKRSGIFRLSDSSMSKVLQRSRMRQTQEVNGLGFVVGILETPSSLKIASPKGVFTYPMDWSELRSSEALKIGAVVSFSVFAETDASSFIKKIITTKSLSPTARNSAVQNLRQRIQELSELQPGWLDGEGRVPSSDTVIRSTDMSDFIARAYDGVNVFPEQEGGVQFEWRMERLAASLLIIDDEFLLGVSDLNSDKYREKAFRGVSFSLLRHLTSLPKFVGRE
ncbi:MAG: hypothetical protein AAF801_01610 [Pseudomonadota bacterium]